jgi:hypothetical protein
MPDNAMIKKSYRVIRDIVNKALKYITT